MIRFLGYDPRTAPTVSIGLIVCDEYQREHAGRLPPKDLRTKTCGVGVHCFAIYPPEWRRRALAIVLLELRHVDAVLEAQGVLKFSEG